MNSVALPTTDARTRPVWRVAFEIFKPRIALEIMLAGVAGVAITGGSGLMWWQLTVLAAAIFVAMLAGIAYMVVPSIVTSILGSGCI